MDITKNKDGGKLEIKVSGRLDTTTAPQLDSEIKESVDGVTELIFDLGNLEYISSAGLRVLLAAQKTMLKQGSMTVTRPNDVISEIFEVTGFNEILTIEK